MIKDKMCPVCRGKGKVKIQGKISIEEEVKDKFEFTDRETILDIESGTVEALRETITWKIRKIEKIRSTLTLMGIEGQT